MIFIVNTILIRLVFLYCVDKYGVCLYRMYLMNMKHSLEVEVYR